MRRFLRLPFLLWLACAATPAAAVDPDDLLPVDEAFALSARATGPGQVAVDWKIADGYYLYRHRIAVDTADSGASAGALALPRGKAHTDEFFGRVETYRGRLTGTLSGVAAPDGGIALRVKYQGCADLGICYPPQTRTLAVALPRDAGADPAPATGAAATGDGAFTQLGRALAGQGGAAPTTPGTDAAPLPPERAFGFEAIAGDPNTLLLRFTPARGYYLYRDRSSFRLEGARGIAAGAPRWPRGVSHRDEHFGDVVVYFDQVDVPLPLRRTSASAAKATLVATFQGCQTDGICYPPMTRRVAVSIPAGAATAIAPGAADGSADAVADFGADGAPAASRVEADAGNGAAGVAASAAPTQGAGRAATERDASASTGDADAPQADDSRIASLLSGPHRLWALLLFFGMGLGLAFTPCVYPMIPILSGLIAADTSARGGRVGARRGLALSLVYVLASAAVFTVAGVVAGLAGANLQILFQAPWAVALFALLFVALALSMFGLYELQLPAAWRARLGAASDRQRGGSLGGVAAMGALSALIVGPCVAPPLAAAVLYIGQAQDPWFGGAALFALGLGMGAPLLAFGVAAGKGLPTSGPWMVAVQRVFGFVFLALAVWMASRLPLLQDHPALALGLYGVLAFAFAAWLMAQAAGTAAWRRWALRAAAAVFALVGAAQLLGALAGGHDPLQPLAGAFGARQEARELPFRRIKSTVDLQREVAAARAAGKPLLLDFYADWCVACKEMEKYTFPEPQVHAALDGFVLLKADVTANDADDQALMRQLGIVGPPATLYFRDGEERRALRLFGFEAADAFAARAQRARE